MSEGYEVPLSYRGDRPFLYTDYERGVKQSKKEQTVKRYIRAHLSRTFFDGSDVEGEKLREALPAPHAQCWAENEVDPSVAAAGLKKTLTLRSEITALDRVEAAGSFLEE